MEDPSPSVRAAHEGEVDATVKADNDLLAELGYKRASLECWALRVGGGKWVPAPALSAMAGLACCAVGNSALPQATAACRVRQRVGEGQSCLCRGHHVFALRRRAHAAPVAAVWTRRRAGWRLMERLGKSGRV